jgi:hypothetical protein
MSAESEPTYYYPGDEGMRVFVPCEEDFVFPVTGRSTPDEMTGLHIALDKVLEYRRSHPDAEILRERLVELLDADDEVDFDEAYAIAAVGLDL